MQEKIRSFLNKEPLCSLSIIQKDGTPHAATVHFSHSENSFKIYIQTTNTTLKAQPFLDGSVGQAAIVLGFSEEDWLTLQLHGTLRAVTDNGQLEDIYKIHYKKHPDAAQYKGSNTVFLEFTPTWWRYSDYNTEPPAKITSEDKSV
jgi:general stress protein 26